MLPIDTDVPKTKPSENTNMSCSAHTKGLQPVDTNESESDEQQDTEKCDGVDEDKVEENIQADDKQAKGKRVRNKILNKQSDGKLYLQFIDDVTEYSASPKDVITTKDLYQYFVNWVNERHEKFPFPNQCFFTAKIKLHPDINCKKFRLPGDKEKSTGISNRKLKIQL